MEETQFQMRKAEARESLPEADLLPQIPHNGELLDMKIFGPSTYKGNRAEMEKQYFHSEHLPIISFVPATISESISAAAYGFGNKGDFDAKRDIFDPKWLQAGPIVRASEGFFANPQKDAKGNFITNEETLKSYLNGTKSIKVNKGLVYIVPDNETLRNFVYAEYGTFKQGIQASGVFAESGLVMALEHTKTPENLRKIASSKHYKLGVNVCGFDSVREPVLRVAILDSHRDADGVRLGVGGDWVGNIDGYAFGVLNKS